MSDSKKSTYDILMKERGGQFFVFTTTRPVAILMVVLGFCVFGWISYQQLPMNLMPDITYPSLTVRTEHAGTAPEEVETTISRPVEQALGIVNHLVSISSISKAGQSDVKLEFTWDTDMNQATSDVREKLDQVFLPEEVKRPIILRFDPTLDPIMRLGLYGDASLIYLRYLADEEIKRGLETVEGVAAVKVKGGLEEEIRVELNEQQLTLIGIDIQQVRNRLTQENVNLAGGKLKEGQTEYLVRTLNEFKSVDEIAHVVIGNWNGKEIKIHDVAKVSRTFKEREIITRLDNRESVDIEIFKEADANIVEVAQRVKDRVFGTEEQRDFVKQLEEKKKKKPEEKRVKLTSINGKDKKGQGKKGKGGHGRGGPDREAMIAKQMTNFITYTLPENLELSVLSDQSIFIRNSVDNVKNTAVIGGVLAVIVLFIFLRRLSATLIVGISIPVSIVATFAPMNMFGVSLNIMSLGGLALGVGMLVDNSIVVLESIARCREEGDDLIQATIRGVQEVGGAVFASTLTTVAVFFPIVFVEGVAGQVFGNLALTVVFSLFASLAVALFLIPMLSSRQSSRFVQGIQMDQLLKQHVFQFQTAEKIRMLYEENGRQTFADKLKSGLTTFAQTGWLMLLKFLQTVSALLIAFVKQSIILLLVLFAPFLGLLRITGLIKFTITAWLLDFCAQADFGQLTYIKKVWPTFLVNNSAPALIEGMRNMKSAFASRNNIVQGLLLPIKAAFIVARFIFQFMLELVFRLAHTLLIVLTVAIKGLFLLMALIFRGPSTMVLEGFNKFYSNLEEAYPRLLTRALNNRGAVLGTVSALLLITFLVVAPRLGSELIPEVHQGEFNVEITMPVGTPVERTDQRVSEIQEFLKGLDGVKQIAAVSGTDKTANSGSEEGEHTAKLTVRLEPTGNIAAAEEKLIDKIRHQMQHYPGIQWKISRPVLFSFKTPIEVEIHGYNLQKLQQYSRELEDRMATIPGVIDVKSNIQRGNPEVQIVYDRSVLAKFGLNVMDVATIVRNKVRGDVATEFREQDRKIDILVRLREEDKASIADLRRLVINPGAEKPILLSAVADIKLQEGPSEIRRVDQQRTALISANLSRRSLSEASEDIFLELQAMNLPEDFSFAMAGQNKEMETSLESLKLALALAIFLVYIVMASQFESMIHPFIIIFTIPLALIGVILWLFIFNVPLSIVVFLGMIMLAGIVVNNAIVLVDYINKLRERGMEKMAAILQAGKVRLRPILMTTATTVLGLLPMAIGLGDGAEIRTPMAIAVIIGLLTSTVLTLIIIPTVYSLVDVKDVRRES
ncbi:efflux RND transporter permease subunit [candidate division KSB1 bacterium]|nr:efflux RND transporter permease subunit [candidate division KSB1 bacterium]